MRGRKPTAEIVRLVTNNPGHRAMPKGLEVSGEIVKPKGISGRPSSLWDQFIAGGVADVS
jgi:hypothetical protein